jgi:hypothetical protein
VTAIDDEEASRLEGIAPVVRKPFDFADFAKAVQDQLPTDEEDAAVGSPTP